jgi:hypothetical protein
LRFDYIPLPLPQQRNSQRRKNGDHPFGNVDFIWEHQRVQLPSLGIAVQDSDAGVHPNHVSGNPSWRSDFRGIQLLIEEFNLLLISKKRVLESPNQARQPIHINVCNNSGMILHC